VDEDPQSRKVIPFFTYSEHVLFVFKIYN